MASSEVAAEAIKAAAAGSHVLLCVDCLCFCVSVSAVRVCVCMLVTYTHTHTHTSHTHTSQIHTHAYIRTSIRTQSHMLTHTRRFDRPVSFAHTFLAPRIQPQAAMAQAASKRPYFFASVCCTDVQQTMAQLCFSLSISLFLLLAFS